MTNNELSNYIADKSITLTSGKHDSPECGMCALELCSLALGVEWTDSPDLVGLPDIRRLNDAKWCDDETRTREVLRLIVAIWPWRTATKTRRVAFALRLSELTIRRVLPPMLRNIGLHEEGDRCEREGTQESAAKAAAAAYAAAHAAANANANANADAQASYAAANAADYAADYAAAATRPRPRRAAAAAAAGTAAGTDTTLITAIDCWAEAAEELKK